MNVKSECLSCLLNQSLRVAKTLHLDEATSNKMLEVASSAIANYKNISPPVAAADLYPKLGAVVSNEDVYQALKIVSTQEAMKLLPQVQEEVRESLEPLKTAIKASVAGNVIDFASPEQFDLTLEFEKVFHTAFTIDDEALFLERLSRVESLMIVGDNVGEHVFDKVLLETIAQHYPKLALYYAVRGKPIINDVTLYEAKEIGIDSIANLVDSGVDTPGLAYEHASDTFMKLYKSMDLIIAKGMGNYECLDGVGDARIFHLFKVKCEVVSNNVGAKVGSLIFMQNQQR